MESEVKRRASSLRPKSDKLIGGQIGHMGYSREVVDVPDASIDQYSDYCKECGEVLSESEKTFEYSIQEIDIPVVLPIKSIVTRCVHAVKRL